MLTVFLHLLYQIPAAFALTAGARGLLPWELDDRHVPAFMLACCLLALFLPLSVCLALGMVPVVGFLCKVTGTSLRGHDPYVYPHVSLPGFLARVTPFKRQVEYIYQAEHVSGDLKDLAQQEEPEEEVPPARTRQYVPDL
jgi:hypothetical protein